MRRYFVPRVSCCPQAQAVNNPGPRLKEQIARAEALIQQAGAEVRVVLSSDGLTTVTVYRVGSLGTFTTMELSLRAWNIHHGRQPSRLP
jgi:hypothetical protein